MSRAKGISWIKETIIHWNNTKLREIIKIKVKNHTSRLINNLIGKGKFKKFKWKIRLRF